MTYAQSELIAKVYHIIYIKILFYKIDQLKKVIKWV